MEEIKHQPYTNNLNDSLKLHQPLIVISGPFVGSSAEDFLTLIKQTGRAVVVGGPSVGSMGLSVREDNLRSTRIALCACTRALQIVIVPAAYTFYNKLVIVVIIGCSRITTVQRAVSFFMERVRPW